jgi:hypothetical protein
LESEGGRRLGGKKENEERGKWGNVEAASKKKASWIVLGRSYVKSLKT